MDWLLQVHEELAEQVDYELVDLLNLEVDLLFFDTTSTYFEREKADEAIFDADANELEPPFRAYGHRKGHRPDLPQIVIGMAVTRTGIPIRICCWPGNQADQELIRQVKDELRSWKLGLVVWVADRGFASAENRRYLQRAGGHYILGEKLRGANPEARAALSRQGRYSEVAGNLRVKEVVIDDGTMRDRFFVCHNPEEAARDKTVREAPLAQLTDAIEGSDSLDQPKRDAVAARLRAKRGLKRYLRTTKAGLLRVGGRRGPPRRQVLAAHCRPDALGRRRRARLQAAARDRARLARDEDDTRSAPGPPPQPGADSRPPGPVLAGAAFDPPRRDPLRRNVAQPTR